MGLGNQQRAQRKQKEVREEAERKQTQRNERVSVCQTWDITAFHKCHFGSDLKQEGRDASPTPSACPIAASHWIRGEHGGITGGRETVKEHHWCDNSAFPVQPRPQGLSPLRVSAQVS